MVNHALKKRPIKILAAFSQNKIFMLKHIIKAITLIGLQL
ncbi:protein of unknown function [Xenorhabdus poinarii G6]|uniref:Uncharacterized protein n=1 Tax=Xenorhabdus poinarii G6 TaxID=1354304 RepID=A0A068R2B5_9GAMM|nr:protein of unknown function [Xenorhabdus poinarii G6]